MRTRFQTSMVATTLVLLTCGGVPRVVFAQAALSGLTGVVKDAAGEPVASAVVQAVNPALVGRAPSARTDGQGRYQLTDLEPGVYSVSFTAAGFSTVVLKDATLPAGSTGTINAVLTAGSPTDVTTLVAAVSLVDTTSATQNRVVTGEAQKDATGVATATTGVNVAAAATDVGGSSGFYAAQGNALTVRGKAGVKRLFDGLHVENLEGLGNTSYMINSSVVDQVVVETGGGTAESVAAGGSTNSVPKAGTNTFRGAFGGMYTSKAWQGDNLNPTLRGRGLTAVNKVDDIHDVWVTLGGPIRRDALWFFLGFRKWGNQNEAAGVYWNATQGTGYYTPDTRRPGTQFEDYRSQSLRLTWQTNGTNRIGFFFDYPDLGTVRNLPTTAAPEATGHFGFGRYPAVDWRPTEGYGLMQATWSSAPTSRLLIEAGWSYMAGSWPEPYGPGVSPNDVSITDVALGFTWNALPMYLGPTDHPIHRSDRMVERLAVSYVAGRHTFKVGISDEHGWHSAYDSVNRNVNYSFNNGVPSSITEYATPYVDESRIGADMAVFAQDRWAVRRLTLNYGLRLSYFNGFVPAESAAPTEFVPFARNFAAVHCVPCWTDLDPRFGAAYDLFGNGKTALKLSLGRFVNAQAVAIASANNPFNTSVSSVTRAWNNPTGNYGSVPNCVLTNPMANGDCGSISNDQFGLPNASATRYDPTLLNGFGERDYIWDVSATITHQVSAALTVTGGYYYNAGHNFTTTRNEHVPPSAYDPYCVTTPIDPALPGGGGQRVCGLYDVNPALFGHVQNLVTQAARFGQQTNANTFLGVQVSARLPAGAQVSGGVDTGRSVADTCFVVNSPQDVTFNTAYSPFPALGPISAANPTYCRVVIPWSGNLSLKARGTFPLPYGISISPSYQDNAGAMDLAVWNAPNSAIAPSLGRNLAACGTRTVCTATVAIPLIQPGTEYEPRRRQLDVRLSKTVTLTHRARVQLNVDVFNVTNDASIVALQAAYGRTWLKPTKVLDSRLVELGGRLDF